MALWGKGDAVAKRPNWINLNNYPAGTELVYVDAAEAQLETNKAKGFQAPGWWLVYEYTDQNGAKRYNSECLVAITDATVVGDDPANDDDATVVDTVITITEQPFDQTIEEGETANFSVDYNIDGDDSEIAIQWQVSVNGGGAWTDISGEDDFDLQIASTSPNYVDGNQFRAVITGGGAEVISDVATLTITPE